MEEHSLDVMVALRPITSDWCKIALPHLTLVFAGQKTDLKMTDFNELAKTTAAIAMDFPVIQLMTSGLEKFGTEGEKVDVLVLRPTAQLMQMQRRLSSWDKSAFPFNPHCTIGPVGSAEQDELPPALAFDRILLSWGEEALNFWLKP
jgi:2'-5' RNA ligase